MNQKWYQKTFPIIALLILFFPAGLFLMWKYATWRKGVKIGITTLVVLLLLISRTTNNQANQNPTSTPTPVGVETTSPEPTEAPKQVEKFNVVVTSQIVKKVEKKYRYFFDIRNNDSKQFEGEVTITLYNDKQSSPLGKETFNTNRPIEPSLGNSVNFDINTGPTSQHGEYGITKYKYIVIIDGNEVNSGEGVISDKFEDLSF